MMTSSDAGTTIFRNLDAIGISFSAASVGNIATTNNAIVNLNFDKDKFIKAYEADQKAVKDCPAMFSEHLPDSLFFLSHKSDPCVKRRVFLIQ